jgi:hypothetical protein
MKFHRNISKVCPLAQKACVLLKDRAVQLPLNFRQLAFDH